MDPRTNSRYGCLLWMTIEVQRPRQTPLAGNVFEVGLLLVMHSIVLSGEIALKKNNKKNNHYYYYYVEQLFCFLTFSYNIIIIIIMVILSAISPEST